MRAEDTCIVAEGATSIRLPLRSFDNPKEKSVGVPQEAARRLLIRGGGLSNDG